MDAGHRHPDTPAPFLVDNLSLLLPGPTLDVAMGAGRNALYLAEQGFTVTGIDNDPAALREAEERARERGVILDIRRGDFEQGYVLPPRSYQNVICFNYLHRPLFPVLRDALRPGGVIVYETYTIDQARFGPPRNPDHLLRHNELLEVFKDYRCLRYHEGIYDNQKAAAGIIAVKPAV